MYRQEHFTAITSSGGLHLAGIPEILINQVNEALQHPGAFSNARTSILEQVITYTDGRSSERVAEAIQTALAGGYAPVVKKRPENESLIHHGTRRRRQPYCAPLHAEAV